MRIVFNPGLTVKSYYKPIVEATAQEFADAGKIIWKRTKGEISFPQRYTNGKKFAQTINDEKGIMFDKKLLGGYKLTEKGKNWIEEELFVHYLPQSATIGTFVKTIISKIKHLKGYNDNIYRAPF